MSIVYQMLETLLMFDPKVEIEICLICFWVDLHREKIVMHHFILVLEKIFIVAITLVDDNITIILSFLKIVPIVLVAFD
jgi:hypothetical protein